MNKVESHVELEELAPLLQAWTRIAQKDVRVAPGVTNPWWIDHQSCLRSIAQAAQDSWWMVSMPTDDAESAWDLRLKHGQRTLLFRVVCALQPLEEADVARTLRDAQAVADEDLSGMVDRDGCERLAVTVVAPIADAGANDDRVDGLLSRWLEQEPFHLADLAPWAFAYVSLANAPLRRNQAGTAFPGLALVIRKASV
ncbi:hypothetical protein LQ772_15850 [Frateuria edaphi]|uniref:hypothetical protein n=1 Tax=Frateuria edaphi TaxID=2898793 RepID=UPI001E5F718B|nr:hypothetical protein [Frateuria edaphi]UGB45431.1 hypothetical protein LQ772_15850 [Frateuria edaphi]